MGRGGLRGVVLLIGALLLGACSDVAGPDDRDSIEAWMEFHRVPGVSVAVIRDFEIAYLEQYGVLDRNTAVPVDENTRFQAASLSKSASAVVVLSLVEDGVVALDDDIEGYLTSWELPWTVPRGDEPVTLRRLLSHTAGTTVSGFRGYRQGESLPTLLDILNGATPANSAPVVVAETPGAAFSYSGGGYEVMEQAIYDVTGRTWPELARTQVLDPLGMSRSTFRQPAPDSLQPYLPTGHYADGSVVPGGHHTYPEIAAAGLWTTPEDMALFLIDLQRSLRGDSGGVLTRASVELLVTEVRRQYGLGFDLSTRLGQPYFGHQGANDGFRGGMIAHRSSGDGAVILTNSDRGSDLFADVVRIIGARESWPGY
jgi:CubicO group peptidase (beta-lactamase class C family)